ncbi:MAG: DNA ligase, partial [Candidatus Altiarchaeota archaeon]|nr:DNA ligase [Candidatus Altiarchaeota archaeon]
MDFSELSAVFQRLDGISGRIDMTDVIAEFIPKVPEALLPTVLLFLRGRVFPEWKMTELGVAEKIMVKALSSVSGVGEEKIGGLLREEGDMGLVAEKIVVNKSQTTLFSQTLTVEKVNDNLVKLA